MDVKLTLAARFRKLIGWEWEVQLFVDDRLAWYSTLWPRLIAQWIARGYERDARVRVINVRSGVVARVSQPQPTS